MQKTGIADWRYQTVHQSGNRKSDNWKHEGGQVGISDNVIGIAGIGLFKF